jgi:hypothetical protein
MMNLVKCVLVSSACLMIASSRLGAVAAPTANVSQSLAAPTPLPVRIAAAPVIAAATEVSVQPPAQTAGIDAALGVMLVAGLIALQLRRHQKSLQSPRLLRQP